MIGHIAHFEAGPRALGCGFVIAEPHRNQASLAVRIDARIELDCTEPLLGNLIGREHDDRAAVSVPGIARQHMHGHRAAGLGRFFQRQADGDAPGVRAQCVARLLDAPVIDHRGKIGGAEVLLFKKFRPLRLVRRHGDPPFTGCLSAAATR